MVAYNSDFRRDSGVLEGFNRHFQRDYCGQLSHAPRMDYLTLGLYYNPDWHKPIQDLVYSKAGWGQGRWQVRGTEILVDGRAVGRFKFSTAAGSRWGRKLLVHYTGEWFRGGLDEELAWGFTNRFEDYVYTIIDEIDRRDWVKVRSTDRIDWAVEFLRPSLDVTARDVQRIANEHGMLPADLGWKFREGTWSESGDTIYAGTQKAVNANRAQKSMLRVYGYHPEHPELPAEEQPHKFRTLRFECECPKIRTADGGERLAEAQREAALLFESLTPYRYVAEEDLPERWAYESEWDGLGPQPELVPDGVYVIPSPQWGEAIRPETWARVPDMGHPVRERCRQRSQAMTLASRSFATEVGLDIRARKLLAEETTEEVRRLLELMAEELPTTATELERSRSWRERFGALAADRLTEITTHTVELRAALRDELGDTTEFQQVWAGELCEVREDLRQALYPGRRGLPPAPESAQLDLMSDTEPECEWRDLPPNQCYVPNDLTGTPPLELEDLDEHITQAMAYRSYFYPDADQYKDTLASALFYKWGSEPNEWEERFTSLPPVSDQHSVHFVAHDSPDGGTYYVNSITGEEWRPGTQTHADLAMGLGGRTKSSPERARRVRLDRQAREYDERMAFEYTHQLAPLDPVARQRELARRMQRARQKHPMTDE